MTLLTGASGKFTFAEINSALIKSLRRGDQYLALEMAKEYKYKPKCLKRILISTCCEDCPNIYLINDIYNTRDNLENIILSIPAICQHVKSRLAKFAFRVACTMELNEEPITDSDDLLTTLTKMYTILCKNDRNMNSILSYFIHRIRDVKISDIHRYINRGLPFLYLLATWKCIPFMTNRNYERPPLNIDIPIATFINTYQVETLPSYIYDFTISTSPEKNRSFKFYFSTYELKPRHESDPSPSPLEKQGEELFIKYNKMSQHYIRPIIECSSMPENAKLVIINQNNTKRAREERQRFYNFIPDTKDPDYNETIAHVIINNKLYQSHMSKQWRSTKDKNKDIHINFNTRTLFNVDSNTYNVNSSIRTKRSFFCSAEMENGKDVYRHVVKGPFNNMLSIRVRLLSDYLKHYLSLPYSHATVKEYENDLFIYSNNVINISNEGIKRARNSEVYYYDGPMYKYYHFKALKLNKSELLKLFKLLVFRFMIGATTTHAYDFVLYENELYSFNDAVSFAYRHTLFTDYIERESLEVYESFLKRKFKHLLSFIQETEEAVLKNDILDVNQKIFMVNQLSILKDKAGWIFTRISDRGNLI